VSAAIASASGRARQPDHCCRAPNLEPPHDRGDVPLGCRGVCAEPICKSATTHTGPLTLLVACHSPAQVFHVIAMETSVAAQGH
jgi:hypothetical protein